jgi:anti-sigma factor RsiW
MTNHEQDHLALEQLSDWIDGRLSPEEGRAVATHLASCAVCSERHVRLQSLIGAASELPTEIEPPPALWSDVHALIVPAHSRNRQRWLLAAAALFLVALSSAVTAVLVRRPPVIIVRSSSTPAATVASALPAPVRAVDADYAGAIRELDESLAEHRGQLDPTTIAKVEASLHVIDLAIEEARQALAADPSNLTLHDLLAASYERKVELLRRASALLPST